MPDECSDVLHPVTRFCYPEQNLKVMAKPVKFSEPKGCSRAVVTHSEARLKGQQFIWILLAYIPLQRSLQTLKAHTFIFSFLWDRNTLCIASSLCKPSCVLPTPQSLLTNKRGLSQHLPGRRGLQVWFPWPNIGKKQNTPEARIRKHMCIYLKAECHQWSYITVKSAANKCIVSALCCGKQILRDFTGILKGGHCYQEVH